MTIDSSKISIVVQGPVSSLTRRCLLSVTKYLPKAEVILSTWENSNVEGLSFDKVVFSKDPGGVLLGEYKNKKYYDNLNRQIVSTRVGLAQATRQFCIKFRTDMFFTSTGFLRYYNRYPKKSSLMNFRVNGEFYVAPAYNEMIREGKKIIVYNIGKEADGMYGLGIPSDLKLFESLPISKKAVDFS
jgi:hypothetical protein